MIIVGIALLLLSLVTSWLAADPTSVSRAALYSPLTFWPIVPVWPIVYLLAQLSATLLSFALLRSVWRDSSSSLASVAWICVSCAVGISVAPIFVYLPRFLDSFDFATSRTALGPGFFAVLGGYAATLLGTLLLARA